MLEDFTTDLQVPCDQTTEIDVVLGAPSTDFNSSLPMCASTEMIDAKNKHVLEECVNEIPTILRTPIAKMHSSIHLSTPLNCMLKYLLFWGAPFAEIDSDVDSSAPIELHVEIVGLGEPIVPFNPTFNMSAPTEIIIDMTCHLLVDFDYA
jgi:hypothetical protein